MLKTIEFDSVFFNATDTLDCGQVFRYFKEDNGYIVISKDKICYLETICNKTLLTCESNDEEYFYNYFDLITDYSQIFQRAQSSKYEILKKASKLGKGVRILRQNNEEMMFSFLISQNNNIPRIKKALNLICEKLGEKIEFRGNVYFTFPSLKALSAQTIEFYRDCGLGYRAEYFKILAEELNNGLISKIKDLDVVSMKRELISIKGIGEKVADCIALFGFYKTQSFPVDVWIERIYREDFSGTLTNRNKITAYFIDEFGKDAGYFQQYLFYYKRTLEKSIK